MRDRRTKGLMTAILAVAGLINVSLAAPSTFQLHEAHVSLEKVQSQLEDKVVAELEHLKHPSTTLKDEVSEPEEVSGEKISLPGLQKQLEDLSTSKHESPVFPNHPRDDSSDVEDPITHTKSTTVTSHVQHPNMPPFHGEEHEREQQLETTTRREEEKATPKTYSGAGRLTGCSSCGADHPLNKERVEKEHEVPEGGSEVTQNGQKRINLEARNTPSVESLFSQGGKQYSASDLAQYIFWTGDETGVARAVEELIDQEVLSRESALVLLKEIRAELETLQDMYPKDDLVQPSFVQEEAEVKPTVGGKGQPTLSPLVLKTLSSLPHILKMNEIAGSTKKEPNIDYDEATGRLRLADFLYAEYSLEEVIYQLAKVMFSQSLNQGSDEAQVALQRLTSFLENEGAHGRISAALQKKVLDVLLAALSDTLNESPEMMAAAKQALGGYLNKLPKKLQPKN